MFHVSGFISFACCSVEDEMVLEYLELVRASPLHSRGRTSLACLRGHFFKFLFTALAVRVDLRAQLTRARDVDELVRLRL